MQKFFNKFLVLVFSLCVWNISVAAKFCDSYDANFTKMEAVNGNKEIYSGMPQKLTEAEFKNLPKKWDGYCPACTLKQKNLCKEYQCQQYNLMSDGVYNGIQVKADKWIKMANAAALNAVQHGGGPFAAIIVQVDDQSGEVIRYWVNHNHVAEWHDPTAHAEVTAIRAASQQLGIENLGHIHKKESKLSQPNEWSHCVLYSSAESCPMCLSAIYWSGIKNVVFSATRYDAAAPGVAFSDAMIYAELARPYAQRQHMDIVHANADNSLDAFNYYKRNNVPRYGDES